MKILSSMKLLLLLKKKKRLTILNLQHVLSKKVNKCHFYGQGWTVMSLERFVECYLPNKPSTLITKGFHDHGIDAIAEKQNV